MQGQLESSHTSLGSKPPLERRQQVVVMSNDAGEA